MRASRTRATEFLWHRQYGLCPPSAHALELRTKDVNSALEQVIQMMSAMSQETSENQIVPLRLQMTSRQKSVDARFVYLRWKSITQNQWIGQKEFDSLLAREGQHTRDWMIQKNNEATGINLLARLLVFECQKLDTFIQLLNQGDSNEHSNR